MSFSVSRFCVLLFTWLFIALHNCHAQTLPLDFILSNKEVPWRANLEAGNKAYEQANYTQSLHFLKLAQKQIQEFNSKDPEMSTFKDAQLGTCLNIMALAYSNQDKYDEAVPLSQQALHLAEQTEKPEGEVVAIRLINLARMYNSIGKNAEVKSLLERALAISKTAPMSDEIVAEVDTNVADWYNSQCMYSEARDLFEQILRHYEKYLGPANDHVATTLINLTSIYIREHEYAKAEAACKRALSIYGMMPPADRPQVAACLNDLGVIAANAKNYAQAESYYKRSIAMDEKIAGKNNKQIITTLKNLAELYNEQGKVTESGEIGKRILAIQLSLQKKITVAAKAANSDNTTLSKALDLIQRGRTYMAQLQFQLAEPCYAEALKILGDDETRTTNKDAHDQYVGALKGLISSLVGQKKDKEALEFVPQLFKEQKMVNYSPCQGHLSIASQAAQVGDLYYAKDSIARATLFYEKSVNLYQLYSNKCMTTPYGEPMTVVPFPSILFAMRKLGDIYERSGKVAEGRKLKQLAQHWTEYYSDR